MKACIMFLLAIVAIRGASFAQQVNSADKYKTSVSHDNSAFIEQQKNLPDNMKQSVSAPAVAPKADTHVSQEQPVQTNVNSGGATLDQTNKSKGKNK